MIGLLIYPVVAYVLWVMFLAVMALANAWRDLTMFVKVLALPAVVVAILLDIAFNLAATVIFFDLPREATFSQRMSRYKQGSGWRCRVACWVCGNLLDPFQVGGHCR